MNNALSSSQLHFFLFPPPPILNLIFQSWSSPSLRPNIYCLLSSSTYVSKGAHWDFNYSPTRAFIPYSYTHLGRQAFTHIHTHKNEKTTWAAPLLSISALGTYFLFHYNTPTCVPISIFPVLLGRCCSTTFFAVVLNCTLKNEREEFKNTWATTHNTWNVCRQVLSSHKLFQSQSDFKANPQLLQQEWWHLSILEDTPSANTYLLTLLLRGFLSKWTK